MKVDFSKLDRAFNPRCVAVVGDSTRDNFRWLRSQRNFKGKLYSVQVNPQTIESIEALGVENYTSLRDIPEPVDLVIAAVPRAAALEVLDDCIAKEVAAAHFYTSGFSETASEEGIRLERLLAERAEETNFHLIGPNCLGIFNPELEIKYTPEQFSNFTGQVGFISQSGTNGIHFGVNAYLQGVYVSKAVSFGNGIVLDSADFLEYFVRDPETKVIGMYLEGVKDGRRFLRVLREVAARKPVVIWKGGRTEAGMRAIASHTGSLALSQVIWNTAVKQCGALSVNSNDELIDTLKALLYLSPVYGDRVAIAGGSGGESVAIADVFSEAGLLVPRLTQESYDDFSIFFSLIGGGYVNPIDTGNANRRQMTRIMEILERDNNIDNLVMVMSANTNWQTTEQIQENINLAAGIRARDSKPVMAIVPFSTSQEMEESRNLNLKLREINVPSFSNMERGASALRNALDYYRQKNGRG